MGLLAADRKKQRWSGDPRGKSWSENKNKISNKMMEKMGWKDGEGLGADGQGMLNPIGIKYKMDNLGFGCTQKYDKQWIEHQDSFNDLLAGLNQATGNEIKPVIRLADTVEVSSLEKTGSKLGHRYKKATRAKDISNATAKDMEGIFGRSSQSEKKAEEERIKQAEKEAEDLKTKPQFEESSKHVKQTETVHDYFKRKMAERAERLKNMAAIKCEVKTENTEDDTPLPQLMNSEGSEVKEDDLGIKTERIEDDQEVTEQPKKKKKKKKSKPAEEVETEEIEEVPKKKKKRKVEEVTEEQVDNIEESVPSEETPKKKKKKKRKKETSEVESNETVEENVEVPEEPETKPKKSKKKKKKTEEDE